jgi:hypothetical protein
MPHEKKSIPQSIFLREWDWGDQITRECNWGIEKNWVVVFHSIPSTHFNSPNMKLYRFIREGQGFPEQHIKQKRKLIGGLKIYLVIIGDGSKHPPPALDPKP